MANLRVIAEIKPAGDFPVVDAPNVSVTGGKRLDVALSEAAAEVAKKANKSEVDTALASKANKSEVDTALASKANKSEVDTALASKANKSEVDAALAGKANKSEVDAAIENKADKSAFEAINASVSVNTSNIQELSTESTVLSARMDEFTKLEEGSTTGDAELIDGRVSADGKTYDNIGGAIRGQVTDLKSDLTEQNHVHSINLHKAETDSVGYLLLDNGTLSAYSEYTTTDFIKVESGKTYFRSRAAGGGLDCYYDSNKNFVRKLTSEELSSKSITIPSGVRYIRVSRYTALKGIHDLYLEDVNETVPYQLTLDDDVKVKFENLVNVPISIKDICSADGKNILVMGDSIFGQVNDETGVCAKIKEKTNANVINCAFGGTQATGRSESNGYQSFDLYYLVDALISGDYTTQENAVATGTLPSYYGDKLNTLKALDWSTIDIITMNYGTNDFTYGTGSARYRNRYKEALTKFISAYPHIKVVIITPAYRLWLSDGVFSEDSNTHKVGEYTLIDYITQLTTVLCKDLNLPYIDLYNIGINQYNWNQYFASGDTTHQNEYGRNYIADIVAKKLCTM